MECIFGVFNNFPFGAVCPISPSAGRTPPRFQTCRTICGQPLCSPLPRLDGDWWVEGFFFLWPHISLSFRDWFGALGTLLPHCIKWDSDRPWGCCQWVTFPTNTFAFLQESWGEDALNQRKGFNHGNFRLWEKLKEVMFDIASCTHQITLHIKHRQGDTNSLNSSILALLSVDIFITLKELRDG